MKRESINAVMTTDPQTVQIGQAISDAYAILKNATFHHLPVVDGDRPVGMVASTDILRLAYDVTGVDERTLMAMLDHQFTLEDAMTDDPITLTDSASVKDAAEHMKDGTIHSVLVVDEIGDLVGIVTSTNLIQHLLTLVR